MKRTAAANSVSDMVHDAAAAHPSVAPSSSGLFSGQVEADWNGGVGLRGGKGSAPNAHGPFRLMSKTDGSRSIPAE